MTHTEVTAHAIFRLCGLTIHKKSITPATASPSQPQGSESPNMCDNASSDDGIEYGDCWLDQYIRPDGTLGVNLLHFL